MATHELEVEMRKIVRFDLEALQREFPDEWAECVEQYGEDDALYEFVTESWMASPELFESTAFDGVEYDITALAPPAPGTGATQKDGGSR